MRFIVRKIIKYFLLPFGILYQLFNGNKDEIIILMYHRIKDDIKKELSIKKNHFSWQMNYLKKNNYSVLSMSEAYEKIKNNAIKGRHMVISFDDGYQDYYSDAFPVLKQHQFPSILYLVPGYIDNDQVYWWDVDIGQSQLLSWEKIRELGGSPLIEFGSHTLNHYDLNTIKGKQLEYELQKSKDILQEKLKKPVEHFSYPRGIHHEEAEKMIKQIYDTGVLIFNGEEITPPFDIENRAILKRIPIQRSDGKYLFIARIRGWLVVEEFIRRIISKVFHK